MSKALRSRLKALEVQLGPGEDLPTAIFIGVKSCRLGAPNYTDHDILSVEAGSLVLERLPGETVEELQARAEAVPPTHPGSVRVWLMRYRDIPEPDNQAESMSAMDG